MKILFLNYEYPPLGAGAGNATFCLLQEYAKIPGLEVHLVTSSVDGKYHHFSVGDSVFVYRLPIVKNPANLHFQSIFDLLRYSWAGYRFGRKLLSQGDFDAIHAFFSVPCGAQAFMLGRRFKIPYIVSLRGGDVPGYSERFSPLYVFLKPLIRFIWQHAAAVVSNSQGLKELAWQTNPEQVIDIIYNGIDSDHFVPKPAARPKDAFILTLGASRVTARKGIEYLIEAVSSLVP